MTTTTDPAGTPDRPDARIAWRHANLLAAMRHADMHPGHDGTADYILACAEALGFELAETLADARRAGHDHMTLTLPTGP